MVPPVFLMNNIIKYLLNVNIFFIKIDEKICKISINSLYLMNYFFIKTGKSVQGYDATKSLLFGMA